MMMEWDQLWGRENGSQMTEGFWTHRGRNKSQSPSMGSIRLTSVAETCWIEVSVSLCSVWRGHTWTFCSSLAQEWLSEEVGRNGEIANNYQASWGILTLMGELQASQMKSTLPGIFTLLLIFPPLCWSNNEWVRKIIWKSEGKKRTWRQKNMALHKGRERVLSENKRTFIKRKKDPSILQNLERNSMQNFYCTRPRCSLLEEYHT